MKDLFWCCKLKFIYFPLQWKLHRLVLLLLLVFVQLRLDVEAALLLQKISGYVFCSLKQKSTILLRRNVTASGWKHGFISIASVWKILLHLLWSSKLYLYRISVTALQQFYSLVRSGARPWYPWDQNHDEKWSFPFSHVTEDYDETIMYYASDEWRKMFDAWSFFCFKIAGFEIVRTANMGLGIILIMLLVYLWYITKSIIS